MSAPTSKVELGTELVSIEPGRGALRGMRRWLCALCARNGPWRMKSSTALQEARRHARGKRHRAMAERRHHSEGRHYAAPERDCPICCETAERDQ